MKINNVFIIGLCLIMALFSCKKDNSNIGADISGNPGKVSAAIVDTFNVVTYSALEDTVTTSQRSSPMLGITNSNEVGVSASSLFATFIPDSLDRTFPTSDFQIDSFYLKLHIVDVYGKNISQSFEVYQLDSAINADSTYYNYDSLSITNKLGTIVINESDSGLYQFNLDSAAGVQLMSSLESDYESEDNFKSFFSGILIKPVGTPSSNDGAIYLLNRTGISLHLKFSTTNGMEANFDTEINYVLKEDNYLFAKYNHNLSGSDAEQVLNDSTLGQQSFYIQGMSGAYGKVNFPTVQNWFDTDNANYILNQFEIQVFVEEHSTFNLPEQLMFTYINSDGVRSYTTAVLDSEDDSYTFSISPSEVNTALENGEFSKMDFEIAHPFPGSNPHQVKLYGLDGLNAPKLKLSFTKF